MRMTDSIAIRPLRAADAEQLTACFRRCYGDSYVADFFYDPDAIRGRIGDGRLHSVVAVTPERKIVGHMALTSRHPNALTVEAGNTVVDPRYRGRHLAARLGAALLESCRAGGYVGFHHYPTTAHPIMQKLAVHAGGVETGVMLAYVPEDTDYRDLSGKSEQGRLAVVTVYQPIGAAPAREVYLPPRFEPMLRAIYERAGLPRRASAPTSPSVSSPTRLRSTLDARRGLLRSEVDCVGADVESRIDSATRGSAAALAHVDLLLSDPGTPHAVEVLRTRDFFFCALLPEFAAGDVLRLQRVRESVQQASPGLVYPEAREILRTALADLAAARAGRAP